MQSFCGVAIANVANVGSTTLGWYWYVSIACMGLPEVLAIPWKLCVCLFCTLQQLCNPARAVTTYIVMLFGLPALHSQQVRAL